MLNLAVTDKNRNRAVAVITALFILLTVNIILVLRNSYLISKKSISGNAWSEQKMRDYAGKLKASGLTSQARRAYEEYIETSNADAEMRCNIYYSLGEMFLRSEQYEEALSYFFKAEIAEPDTDLKADIGEYIVTCLEKMGKSLDAEYQLESRAALKSEKTYKKGGGEVVAKLGNRDITMEEINEEIEKLPSDLREEFTKDETKKLEFLRQYVANLLLYDKGYKLGYAKDPSIREQSDKFKRQLVIQKVIENEVNGKIRLDADDIKNYFEANKDKYKDDKGDPQTFEEAQYRASLDYRTEKSRKLVNDLLENILDSKEVFIYGEKFTDKRPPAAKKVETRKNKTEKEKSSSSK